MWRIEIECKALAQNIHVYAWKRECESAGRMDVNIYSMLESQQVVYEEAMLSESTRVTSWKWKTWWMQTNV